MFILVFNTFALGGSGGGLCQDQVFVFIIATFLRTCVSWLVGWLDLCELFLGTMLLRSIKPQTISLSCVRLNISIVISMT